MRASNSTGASSWSSTRNFTTIIAAPTLTSPSDNSTVVSVTPTFVWSSVSGAIEYTLQIATDADFTTNVNHVYTQSLSASYSLDYNTLYYWRVKATNSEATSGSWSEVRSFRTMLTPPAAPTLTSPSDNSTVVSVTPTFVWSSVSGAIEYTLQIATDADFTTNVNHVYTQSLSASYSLDYNTLYYWRVKATNSEATSGSWSEIWSFTTPLPWITISGFVENTSTSFGVPEVTIELSNEGGTTTTDSSGTFYINVSAGWSGRITPLKRGLLFVPSSDSLSNVDTSKYVHFEASVDTSVNFTVTISSNPLLGGTTTGGGNGFYYDQLDTIKAIANQGYKFLKWTSNDSSLSKDSTFIFKVIQDTSLVANFEEIIWHINDNGIYYNKGYVGIGTTIPDAMLTVAGTIHATEVIIEPDIMPDYVFENSYNLLPLEEVESFIKENKHLPEIPSAREVEEQGIHLSKSQTAILKKIEELSLYLIDIKKEQEKNKTEFSRLVNNK